jgi:tetratricopeptide (TPR) repeat protein
MLPVFKLFDLKHVFLPWLLFFMVCSTTVLAQSNNIDSLQGALKTAGGLDKFRTLKALVKAYQKTDPEKAYETALSEREEANLLGRQDLVAEAMNDMAIPLLIMQRNREALVLLHESVRIYDSLSDAKGYAMSLTNLGIAWSQHGSYEKALECYQKAIVHYQKTQDEVNLAKTYMSMGLVYETLHKHAEALEFALKSKALFEKTKSESKLADIEVNIGISNKSLGKFKEAEACFISAIAYYKKSGNLYGLAVATTNLANAYQESGAFAKADAKYSEALPLIRSINNRWAEANLFFNLAEMQISRKRWTDALVQLEKAEKLNAQIADPKLAADIANAYCKTYEALGNEKLALKYFRNYAAFNDSIGSEKKTKIIEELTIGFEVSQKAAEIELLKKSIKAEKLRQTLLWVTLFGLVLIGGLLFGYLSLKKKNLRLRKEQVEQEKKIMQAELETALTKQELQKEETEKLFYQVQLKDQELVFQTMQRVELYKLNRSIVEKLQSFRYKIANKKDQADYERTLSEISRDTDREPMADFEVMFKQLHKTFFDNLTIKCGALSKTELQICALLRSNLATKDIARLLNLSAASIDMCRHRIRQKLELDQKQSLVSYLITL